MDRFFVKAASVNSVRRALDRAPGGARVIGRFDRETIECGHTMAAQSLSRHWPIVLSRLDKAGLDRGRAPRVDSGALRTGFTRLTRTVFIDDQPKSRVRRLARK